MDLLPTLPDQIYLRLSITDRCNLRCLYCRPAEGDGNGNGDSASASRDELLSLVEHVDRVAKIDKVRLTGGEPLLVRNPEEWVDRIHRLLPTSRIGMTTNGVLLGRHAARLHRAGLQYLNISLDTPEPENFEQLTRGGQLRPILTGIETACQVGIRDIKINTVLLKSFNGDQVLELVRLAARWQCELRFIELMPMGEGADLHREQFLSADEAHAQLKAAFTYIGPAPGTGTARRHRFVVNNNEITLGYITTVSHPFCDACDRYRLDSWGRFFSCLRDKTGQDLLSPLRAGQPDVVEERVRMGLALKNRQQPEWPDRSMAAIGG